MIYVTLYRMAFSCKASSVPKRDLQSHHNVTEQRNIPVKTQYNLLIFYLSTGLCIKQTV